MRTLYLIVTIVVSLVLLLGVSYLIYRAVVTQRMINNSEKLFPGCKGASDAASCYVNALIADIGFGRAAAIINDGAAPTIQEAAQGVAEVAKCAVQNCRA